MRALIRALQSAASLQSGANQQALLILADKLHADLSRMMEASAPKAGVAALTEVNATIARIAAEYVRLQLPTPFALPKQK